MMTAGILTLTTSTANTMRIKIAAARAYWGVPPLRDAILAKVCNAVPVQPG